MILGLYIPADSLIHRLPPGVKVACLVIAGTVIFSVRDWTWLAGAVAGTIALYVVARISLSNAFTQLRPAFGLLIIILVFQAIFDHWMTGVIVVLRFVVLILLASLVTLTTRVSEMVAALECALKPLAKLGVNPSKAGLAISMTIRFIPVLAQRFGEIREAQRARGLEYSIAATAVPLIVRTLKMANDIAEALDARSYEGSVGDDPAQEKKQAKNGLDGNSPTVQSSHLAQEI